MIQIDEKRLAIATHCSLSMSMSFSSKSLWRSWPGLSNRKVTESPVSSACIRQGKGKSWPGLCLCICHMMLLGKSWPPWVRKNDTLCNHSLLPFTERCHTYTSMSNMYTMRIILAT